MENMNRINFLKSFFLIFESDISVTSVQNEIIRGYAISQIDSESQEFLFDEKRSELVFQLMARLCDFISKQNLVVNDQMKITEDELRKELTKEGWPETQAQNAINELFNIEVKMIEEETVVDSFYLHF